MIVYVCDVCVILLTFFLQQVTPKASENRIFCSLYFSSVLSAYLLFLAHFIAPSSMLINTILENTWKVIATLYRMSIGLLFFSCF